MKTQNPTFKATIIDAGGGGALAEVPFDVAEGKEVIHHCELER